METKTTSKKGQLIRKLHVLRGAVGMTQEEYETLIGSYGVESSKELEEWQLEKLCEFLGKQANSERRDIDRQRKRAIAAVCQYIEAMGTKGYEGKDAAGRVAYAKGVICRAAKVETESFNRIGLQRLRGLTAMFNKMRKDMDGVVEVSYGIIGRC